MSLPALFRLIFLLLAGLACGPALADLDATYEGQLIPETFDMPIPITIQLKDQSGRLTGTVTTGAPYPATVPISSGENRGGQCEVRVMLAPSVTLKLSGNCYPGMLEGRYSLNTNRDGNKPKGLFRLMRKEAKVGEEGKASGHSPGPSSSGLTDCIKANTRCLLTCPQGDYNAEFLCSNRCRHKYRACKANFSAASSSRKLGSMPPADTGVPSSTAR